MANSVMQRILFASISASAFFISSGAGDCGDATQPLSTIKKNVLFIGDSISMAQTSTCGGYGNFSIPLLEPEGWFPQHNGGWGDGGQASNTVKGLECSNYWLNVSGTFDVIHFNFGLHDLVTCTDNPECSEHVDLETYGKNLVTIYNRLKLKAKRIIFGTTTPCPAVKTSLGRNNTLVQEYNAKALSALRDAGLTEVCDLYGAIIQVCGNGYKSCPYQCPTNVHFDREGREYLAKTVNKCITSNSVL